MNDKKNTYIIGDENTIEDENTRFLENHLGKIYWSCLTGTGNGILSKILKYIRNIYKPKIQKNSN
jgi:hypothetical protein